MAWLQVLQGASERGWLSICARYGSSVYWLLTSTLVGFQINEGNKLIIVEYPDSLLEQIKLSSFIVNSNIKIELTNDERDKLRLREEKKEHDLALKDYERRAKEKKKAILEVVEWLSHDNGAVTNRSGAHLSPLCVLYFFNRRITLKGDGQRRGKPSKMWKN